jgi:hypothetical protein
VIVRVDDRGVHILSTRIDWSSQIPKVIAKARNTLPLSSTAAEVAQAITRVWAQQLSKYQWCARCHERLRAEHMFGGPSATDARRNTWGSFTDPIAARRVAPCSRPRAVTASKACHDVAPTGRSMAAQGNALGCGGRDTSRRDLNLHMRRILPSDQRGANPLLPQGEGPGMP